MCPRAELVSPCCAGSQRALSDPGLPSHLTLPSSCFRLGRMDGAVVTVGPEQGTGAWAKGAIPMGTFSWQMVSCTLEQSVASRETTQPSPGAKVPAPPRLRAPSTGYKVEFCLRLPPPQQSALGRGHCPKGSWTNCVPSWPLQTLPLWPQPMFLRAWAARTVMTIKSTSSSVRLAKNLSSLRTPLCPELLESVRCVGVGSGFIHLKDNPHLCPPGSNSSTSYLSLFFIFLFIFLRQSLAI